MSITPIVHNKKLGLFMLWISITACNTINPTSNVIDRVATENSTASDQARDCLLPGQVRMLGAKFIYLAPRQVVKTSASECNTRGGELLSRM